MTTLTLLILLISLFYVSIFTPNVNTITSFTLILDLGLEDFTLNKIFLKSHQFTDGEILDGEIETIFIFLI